MPRPNRSEERRAELIPILARAFADLGYASATTAALAEAAGLRENQLYRLWPSKKAMFLATIEHLYDLQTRWWSQMLAESDPAEAARRILEEEGRHRGESGLHRIIFAGLSEADDPEIRAAMANFYQRFHKFIVTVLKRKPGPNDCATPPPLAAWSLIALGTFSNIARELDIFGIPTQRRLMSEVGAALAGLDD
ncbi:MAG: TetR/AcrR family transcriptional regulator [Planctomycetota bacterium]